MAGEGGVVWSQQCQATLVVLMLGRYLLSNSHNGAKRSSQYHPESHPANKDTTRAHNA